MEKNLKDLFQFSQYFDAGLKIEKTMKDAKVKLMRLVFDEFRKALDKIAPQHAIQTGLIRALI